MADSAMGQPVTFPVSASFESKSARSTAGSMNVKGIKRFRMTVCAHLCVLVFFTFYDLDWKVLLVKIERLPLAPLL